MDEFIDVYVKATGEKRRIPARWMKNATLAAPFTTAAPKPRTKTASEEPEDTAEATADADSTPTAQKGKKEN